MKKTLVALMALAGVAMGETETVSTYYKELNGQDIAYGFILSLDDAFMTYSGDTLGATFDLDSITLQCSKSEGPFSKNTKLAIFERQGADSLGTFVALSEATAHVGVGNTTYDFTDVITLDTSKQYQFFWVQSNTTADVFSTTQSNQSVYATYAASSRFDRINVASSINSNVTLPKGDGIVYNTGYNSWSGQNMAAVTFNAVAVPEPTTATLSLLALAGLAARRRRK